MNKNILIILALAVGFASCKTDKEDPLISITTPANHSEHDYGSMIEVKATFTDDRDLAHYKVFYGDESGEHLHPFHHEDEANISGTSYEYSAMVHVPDSGDMVAWLHFEVTDAKDKMTTDKLMLHFHH